MTDNLHISLVQSTVVWENRRANIKAFSRLLDGLSGNTDLAVLPETFTTGFSMNAVELGDSMDGETVRALKRWAADYGMALAGSFIAMETDGRCYNRAFLITPEGEATYYDKRHLFRMGGEVKQFTPGDRLAIANYRGWNICLQVCYDLRFPIWSRNTGNAYDLLIYVANWPKARINAWMSLLPARAIENMAYVCGVNRIGSDGEGIIYNGYSSAFSPTGDVVVCAGTDGKVASAYIYKSELERLRNKFPAWKDADKFKIK
jgi:predicted amidohydrolase